MKTQIRDWFKKGCPFVGGVALYQQIQTPYSLGLFLPYLKAKYVPADVMAKLKHALEVHYKSIKTEDQPAPSTPAPKAPPVQNTFTPPSTKREEPPEVRQLRHSAIPVHKLHGLTFYKLQTADTDEARYELALQIQKEILPALDKVYNQIRAYEKDGTIPTALPNQDIIRDTVKKMQKLNTLNSRISKLKRFLKGELPANKKLSYEKELLEKELNLTKLKAELPLDDV